jgi:hypothetical protein
MLLVAMVVQAAVVLVVLSEQMEQLIEVEGVGAPLAQPAQISQVVVDQV